MVAISCLVMCFSGAKFTVTPDYGYHISQAMLNGELLNIDDNEIILDSVTEDSHLSVNFEKDLFEVATTTSDGAYIYTVYNGYSDASTYVPYMDKIQVIVEVDDGYKLNNLYVNSVPVKIEKTAISDMFILLL